MNSQDILSKLSASYTNALEIGRILHEIRTHRLYRPATSFNEYCAMIAGFSENIAKHYINAYLEHSAVKTEA